jgi:hypothetical protein
MMVAWLSMLKKLSAYVGISGCQDTYAGYAGWLCCLCWVVRYAG